MSLHDHKMDLRDSGVSEIISELLPTDTTDLEGKTIPLETVISHAYTLYIEQAHVPDKTFELIIDTLDYMATPAADGSGKILGLQETLQFLESVYYMIKDGDISYLTKPRGLKVDRIVDIEEFILSPEYMNQRRFIRPPILKSLIEAFSTDEYTEFVLHRCITPNMLICCSDGDLPTLEELIGNKPNVTVIGHDGIEQSPTGNPAQLTGIKQLVKLTLTNGMYLECSPDHKIHVFRDKRFCFVPVKDLDIKRDYVITPRQLKTIPAEQMTPEEARFYAYMSSRPQEGTTEQQRIPSRVLRCDNKILAEFINALWACAGTIYIGKKTSSLWYQMGMTGERFIRQLQLALLRFGIQSQIKLLTRKDKYCGRGKTYYWTLFIYGKKNLELFFTHIGLIRGKEEECMQILEQCRKTQANLTVDMIPCRKSDIEALYREYNVRLDIPQWAYGRKNDDISYTNLLTLYNELIAADYLDAASKLLQMFPLHVCYTKIKSIEMTDKETIMGDVIDVIEGHRYIANGISISNSIGWGKNYWADMATAYCLYRLSCYHQPQLEYGLAPGTSIVFVMQSKTYALAKKVVFNQLGAKIRESKYFMKHFPYDTKVTSELRFPNDIYIRPLSSSDTAALGMTVFHSIVDEVNFLARVQKSARADGGVYDQAERIYNTISRRIKTRFHTFGKVPGKLIIISSANQPDDFTARKIKERDEQLAKTGKTDIFAVGFAHWEAYPPHRLSKETFLVDIGDELRPPRLLSSMEEAVDPQTVLKVPMDYYKEFERDIEAAIRDIAGLPVGSTGKYIRQRDRLMKAVELHKETYDKRQLFILPQVHLSEYRYHLEKLLDEEFLSLLPANLPFALHVDAAVSADGDHCGIAVAAVNGYRWVDRTTNWDPYLKQYVKTEPAEYPIILVAGVLEIVPKHGDEIDLELVGRLVQLIATRLRVKYVTADQYQSAQLLQMMRRVSNLCGETIKTGVISVDKDIAPYANLKQAIRDERIVIPEHQTLLTELKELEFDIKKFKVVHPLGGSKDVADAVCGACYVITIPERKQQFKRLGEQRRAEQAEKKRRLLQIAPGIVRDSRWYRPLS